MQGLADGYFVIPSTLAGYIASTPLPKIATDTAEFGEAEENVTARLTRLLSVKGRRTPRDIHRQLGKLLWNDVGMGRHEAGLREALGRIPELRAEFWENVSVPGGAADLNQALEYAGRVADYLEFAELLALDALERRESAGGHFREEYQTPENEAQRDDERFAHVAAWQYTGEDRPPVRQIEPLEFEYVKPSQRSYK
jgi:succinate dehydrogenase / fumarate reductase flavoprotein subunit